MKTVLSILFSVCVSLSAMAQRYQTIEARPIPNHQNERDTSKSKFKLPDKVYVGGSIGLQLGSTTYLDFSPLAGYEVRRGLILGGGGSYSYLSYKERDPYTGAVIGSEDYSIYGAKLFGMYQLPFIRSIFLECDMQAVNAVDLNQPYLLDAGYGSTAR
jgi:hypothetical protein